MHCCAALLYNRRNNNWDKLGASETKLLYTLHWVVLDAAEECADAEYEEGLKRAYDHYLLPIPTLEIFIYLFAPLTSYLKQSDFLTSFRLENGYKIWDPVFQHRHPDIPCFTAEAKPKRDILSAQRFEPKHNAKFGDVFLGGGSFDKGIIFRLLSSKLLFCILVLNLFKRCSSVVLFATVVYFQLRFAFDLFNVQLERSFMVCMALPYA